MGCSKRAAVEATERTEGRKEELHFRIKGIFEQTCISSLANIRGMLMILFFYF